MENEPPSRASRSAFPPGPITIKVREDQRLRYQEAADRAGLPLATWIKAACEQVMVSPPILDPINRWLADLEEEYRQVTRPIDLCWEGWEAFVKENLHRMPQMVTCPQAESIKSKLAHHLNPRQDPCQDRGVDWPCDVAKALLGNEP